MFETYVQETLGSTHYTVIYKIWIPGSHQDALGAEKSKCPEGTLILGEMPAELVQDDQIIERIVRKQKDEDAERMKVIGMTDIKKLSHSKQTEEIRESFKTHHRPGTTFALGMPMRIFQLTSDAIAKFSN
jgi:hypothetical protein